MQVIRHNVFDFIKICTKTFDIIFADPPYDLEGLDTLPDRIFGLAPEEISENNSDNSKKNENKIKKLVKKGGYFILEHPKAYSFENHPLFIKEKKYGNVHFSFFGEKE